MRHEPLVRPNAQTPLIARRRFQLAGALVLAAVLPYVIRTLTIAGAAGDPPNVKPGISGWAQVNQGHVAGVEEVYLKLQYDFYYIKYFSPWLDVLIVFRTIKTIFRASGFGSR